MNRENRGGRLQRVVVTISALAAFGSARGEQFELESAVIDSASGKSLGVAHEKGGMTDFFKAQKSMVFAILRSSGIAVDSLPADVRGLLEKSQTTNLEAFKAFSQGLDLMDEGKFASARVFFEKALELDPNFKLAEERKISMPSLNLTDAQQIRTVMFDNSKSAVDSGKHRVEVDLSRAIAAMQSGQTVIVEAGKNSTGTASGPNTVTTTVTTRTDSYTTNPPGSGAEYAPRKAIGIAFDYTGSGAATSTGASIAIALTNQWAVDQYKASGNSLESVGEGGDFVAQRGGATACCSASYSLSDGSAVYWGTWKSSPGASASVIVSGVPLTAPTLGSDVHYMIGDATKQMPTSGTAVFSPVGGFLGNVVGDVSVNFVTRQVNLNNLGFTLGNLSFSQLNGATTYDAGIASGFFKGNYNSGSCTGCASFSPAASAFTGNFVGASANGAIVSSIMQNGGGTVAGVHLFAR